MVKQELWERGLLITTLDAILDYQKVPVSTAGEGDAALSLSVKGNYIADIEMSVGLRLARVVEMRLYSVGLKSGAVTKKSLSGNEDPRMNE